MKILAGDQTIPVKDMVYSERVMAEEQMRDGRVIILSGAITDEQITALAENDWSLTDDSGELIETHSGFNTLVRHELVFAKVQTKQEEIDAALKPVLDTLTDDQAVEFVSLYPEWTVGVVYAANDRVRYNDTLYKCLTNHTSQSDWTPEAAPSLWAKVLTSETGDILEWVQPDSTNGYAKGDKVTHNGKTWESAVDNNVWEPGATGTESLWTEVV